jgi:hypothetical protein
MEPLRISDCGLRIDGAAFEADGRQTRPSAARPMRNPKSEIRNPVIRNPQWP